MPRFFFRVFVYRLRNHCSLMLPSQPMRHGEHWLPHDCCVSKWLLLRLLFLFIWWIFDEAFTVRINISNMIHQTVFFLCKWSISRKPIKLSSITTLNYLFQRLSLLCNFQSLIFITYSRKKKREKKAPRRLNASFHNDFLTIVYDQHGKCDRIWSLV